MKGRFTLGLYNTYDPKKLHDIHIRSIARAAPVTYAFDFNLALFGFPADKASLVELISKETTIGESGEYLIKLDKEGRLSAFDFPSKGFPPQLGKVVLTASTPNSKKAINAQEIIKNSSKGVSYCIIIGLGRKGLPKKLLDEAEYHLELTGKNIPLETCTVIGIIPAMFYFQREI